MKGAGTFKHKYFSETVAIYNFLQNRYKTCKTYFSDFLGTPSVVLETKKYRVEFHIKDNAIQNEKKWLYSDWDTKNQSSGGGYGAKLVNMENQIKEFFNIFKRISDDMPKIEFEQLTLF